MTSTHKNSLLSRFIVLYKTTECWFYLAFNVQSILQLLNDSPASVVTVSRSASVFYSLDLFFDKPWDAWGKALPLAVERICTDLPILVFSSNWFRESKIRHRNRVLISNLYKTVIIPNNNISLRHLWLKLHVAFKYSQGFIGRARGLIYYSYLLVFS